MKYRITEFRRSTAFTLIELLIVVAIIAILAAIAVPNFLEAQVRAKISRCKNDLRTVDLALNAYQVDNNHYPYPKSFLVAGVYASWIQAVYELTTPVAFITSVNMKDPFNPANWGKGVWPANPLGFEDLSYKYIAYDGYIRSSHGLNNGQGQLGFMLSSYGPDRKDAFLEWAVISGEPGQTGQTVVPFRLDRIYMIYDSTNGTISSGDIGRFGGTIQAPSF